MKVKTISILMLATSIIMTSCGNGSTQTTNETEVATTSSVAKLDIFNDINKTRQSLSENGIGNLGEWKSDQMGGFFSITNYFQFGGGTMQNNIAYYLESEDESYIQTAKLTLNINNKSEKKQALTKFKDLTTATFKSLSLEIPKELIESIDAEKEFESSNNIFSASVKLDKNKIDTWTLKITTK